MKAGREMDALVAEKVMGIEPCDNWIGYTWDNELSVSCVKHSNIIQRECYPTRVYGLFGEYDLKDHLPSDFGSGPLPEWFRDNASEWDESLYLEDRAVPPPYSTSISSAWEVVEKLAERWLHVDVCSTPDEHPTKFICVVRQPDKLLFLEWRADEDSAPLAICLAALRAVGVEVDDE